MKEPHYHLYLDDDEHSIIIRSLNTLKTELIENGITTDAVDDLIVKVGHAPQKKLKVQLLLEEQEYPSVKLNSNFDWESLYYEYLRSLDNTKYSGCALIYINDDDVPELYIKSQSLDKSDMICFVTENGLFVSRINISDSRVKSACLTKRSLALTEQVVTIDKRRIIRKMGNIKLKSLFKIGTALMIGMGLNNNTFKKGSHK